MPWRQGAADRQRKRAEYAQHVTAGICHRCREQRSVNTRTKCAGCLEIERENQRQRRALRKDKAA